MPKNGERVGKEKMNMKKKALNLAAVSLIIMLILSSCSSAPTTTGTIGTTTKPTTTSVNTTATTADPGGWKSDPNLNEPGVEPICIETVTLTVGLRENANVTDFKTNDMTKLIEERGNFDLQFKYYTSEMATQINLIIAGGDFKNLPDVIMMSPGDAYVYQWGQAGAILPLNEYYENSSFYLKEAEDRTGVDFKQMITSPDGNYYGIPTYNQSLPNENPAKMWIYQPWLDALDLEVPKTTEDLFTVLKAFLEEDPNGNGQADEIPLLGLPYNMNVAWKQALISPFQYIGGNQYVVNDGKVGVWYNTSEYREALKYINTLFSDRLLPDYLFTIDQTAYNNLASNADTAIVGVYVYSSASDTARLAEYTGFGPLANPDGRVYTAFVPSSANIAYMISSACESAEAAFRLGDLLVSEDVSIMTRWGNEGQHWDYLKNYTGDLSKLRATYETAGFPGYLIVYEDPWGIVQNFHWYQAGPFIRQYGVAAGRVAEASAPIGVADRIAMIIKNYMDVTENASKAHTVGKLIFNNTELNAITEILSSLEVYESENFAYFALGNNDINDDAVWNNYLAQLDAIGLQDVLKIVQNVYDRMYK